MKIQSRKYGDSSDVKDARLCCWNSVNGVFYTMVISLYYFAVNHTFLFASFFSANLNTFKYRKSLLFCKKCSRSPFLYVILSAPLLRVLGHVRA